MTPCGARLFGANEDLLRQEVEHPASVKLALQTQNQWTSAKPTLAKKARPELRSFKDIAIAQGVPYN